MAFRTVLLSTSLFGFGLFCPGIAYADCVYESGTGTETGNFVIVYEPDAGAVVRCQESGTPRPAERRVIGGADNVTLINESGHALFGRTQVFNFSSSSYAVDLGDDVTLQNSGSISSGTRLGNNANVNNSGGMSGTSLSALQVGNNSVVVNSGSLFNSANNGVPNATTLKASAGSTVTNTDTGRIVSSSSRTAVSLSGAGNLVTRLTNNGTVQVSFPRSFFAGNFPYAIEASNTDSGTILIDNFGEILSSGNGIALRRGATHTLNNSGTISIENAYHAILVEAPQELVDISRFNTGMILTESSGTTRINNSGTIRNESTLADAPGAFENYIKSGIFVDNSGVTFSPNTGFNPSRAMAIPTLDTFIVNSGIITSNGYGIFVKGETRDNFFCDFYFAARGSACLATSGLLNISNSGTIIGNAGNNGMADGLLVENGVFHNDTANDFHTLTSLTQTDGMISGHRGVVLAGGADTINLFGGQITGTGGTAIDLGAGDDLLVMNGLGTVTGDVLGGAGIDTLNLTGSGGDIGGRFQGFENLLIDNGLWAFTGAQGFADTQVTGGILSVIGTFDGPVTIGANGILNDLGTINGNVTNNGTIGSTGNVGVLTINGDLNSAGTIVIDLGVNSLFVTGDANLLAGSTIAVNVDSASAAQVVNTPITFLTANGTLTNDATALINITDPGFLFDLMLREANNSLSVELAFQDLSAISSDPNLSTFGQALEDTFFAGSLDPSIVTSLNAVSGEAQYAAAARRLTPSLLYGSTRQLYMASINQMPKLNTRGEGHDGAHAWANGSIDKRKAGSEGPGFPGYDTRSTYGAFGVDYPVMDTVKIGLSAAFGTLDLDENSPQADRTEASTTVLSAYARTKLMGLDAQISTGWINGSFDSARADLGAGQITGSYDIKGLYGQASLAKSIPAGRTTVRPHGTLRLAALKTDTFSETGGLNLSVTGEDIRFADIGAGLSVYHALSNKITPFASLDVMHDLNADDVSLRASIPNGSGFELLRDKSNATRTDFQAGVQFSLSGNIKGRIAYQGYTSKDEQSHGGTIRVTSRF